ncbi:MAG: hydrogenase maturation nickel metallochaperone HypA [bacterium]
MMVCHHQCGLGKKTYQELTAVHEVSIMMSILDLAIEEARKNSAERIQRISLEVGERSGVVIDALEFAFEMVIKNSIAEGASLVIHSIPYKGECIDCGFQFHCDGFLICSKCGNFGKIISGQELRIESIEVE